MFFGEQLKKMRLKYAKAGLRKFAREIDMLPSEYSKIEHGYAPPPDSTKWLFMLFQHMGFEDKEEIKDSLNIHPFYRPSDMPQEAIDQQDLWYLQSEPFVMQFMDEDVFIPHATATDGHTLSVEELNNLSSYIRDHAKEHNKKVREFNKEQ